MFSNGDDRRVIWVTPNVSALYVFSTAPRQHVGLVSIKSFFIIYFRRFHQQMRLLWGSLLVSVLHPPLDSHGSQTAKDASASRDKFKQSLALALA